MTAPGLYVHVPFCARACPYCDFDFEVGRTPALEAYLGGLEHELARALPPDGAGRSPGWGGFDTVYWGGGTPSLLGAAGVRALHRVLEGTLESNPLEEFTVECNPEHLSAPLLEALLSVGVSRLSLGVQSFEPRALEMLGRVHDATHARAGIERANDLGLRVSADLIVGWPGQSDAELRRDLGQLVAAQVDHVSIYALTIEPGTPWVGLVRRGKRLDVDPDAQAQRLLEVEEVLVEHGFEHYEISSYAKPGHRAVHNQKYWNGVDYLGLGPSAASARFSTDPTRAVRRWQNARGLAAWASGAGPTGEQLEVDQALGEALWLGLRQLAGLRPRDLARRLGLDEARVRERIHRPLARGDLVETDGRVALAPGRWLVADAVGVELLSPAPP